MLHLQKTARRATEAADELRFVHEWFAGWRWECHRGGELVAESLQSFDSQDECAADAKRRRAKHAALARQPAAKSGQRDLSERVA